jgi:vancomycin resistance protein YoaR
VRPLRREPDARIKGRRRLVRRIGRVAVLVGAALLVLALLAGFVFAGSADRIAAGVTVAGEDVSGLAPAAAEESLQSAAARSASVPVVFTAGGKRFELTPDDLHVTAAWGAAAEEAADRGDLPLPLRGLQRLWLRFAGSNVRPVVDADRTALDFHLREIAAAVDRRPREAALVLNGLEPEIVPGRTGRELDRVAAADVLLASLGGFERVETPLPVTVDEPTVTRQTLVPVAEQVRTVLSAPVRLTYSGASFTFTPRELARLLELPANGASELRIDKDVAARHFENLARGVARPPRSADFIVRGNGKVRVVAARPGRELNVAASGAALLEAASRPTNRTASLAVAGVPPRITTKEARALGVERQLASYSTLYSGTAERIQNLQLAIDLLDGSRIAPDATWSFNEQVGPRTEERGFELAPVIIDGKYEEGVGGGVSQVATTVFNAAWEAGIRIADRTAHALYISRYPTGRDATVNFPDIDLQLRNDTGRWLVLKASYDESGIVVSVLGSGPRRTVESIPGPLEETGPPRAELKPDPTLYKGDRVIVDDGEPSREVTVQRIVHQRGEVLYRETWYTSYRFEPRIVMVGTKERPVVTAPPKQEDKPKEDKPPPTTTEGGRS